MEIEMAWECRNDQFKTATDMGHPHGPGTAGGSVFREPISGQPGVSSSLWLEYADPVKGDGKTVFWLMWYSRTGVPHLPGSAVFDQANLGKMVELLFKQATPPGEDDA